MIYSLSSPERLYVTLREAAVSTLPLVLDVSTLPLVLDVSTLPLVLDRFHDRSRVHGHLAFAGSGGSIRERTRALRATPHPHPRRAAGLKPSRDIGRELRVGEAALSPQLPLKCPAHQDALDVTPHRRDVLSVSDRLSPAPTVNYARTARLVRIDSGITGCGRMPSSLRKKGASKLPVAPLDHLRMRAVTALGVAAGALRACRKTPI